MATRFRLPSTGTPSVSPAFQSYTHSAALARRTLPTTDDSALFTESRTADVSDHLVAGDSFLRQFVSNPMAAGIDFTTSDTVKYAVQASESNNGNNLSPQVWVGVYSQDGSTLQATLLAKSAHGTEVTTSVINRTKSASIASNYTTESGDRLVVEFSLVGTPTNSGGTQGHNGSFRFGSDGASGDLPEDNTTTTDTFNPWIEFSPTITFGADAALSGQAITTLQGNVTPPESSGQSFGSATGSVGLVFTPTSLSSQLISIGQGTVTASLSGGGALTIGLSGVEASFLHTAGAIKSATALSGQASTTATGTVVGGIAGDGGAQLDGAVATFQSGVFVPNLEADDTYIASAIGSVQYGITRALLGSAITSSDGTMSASVGDVTRGLDTATDPVFIASASGVATSNLDLPLTGLSSSLAQQTMSAPGRADLLGQSATVEQGFFGRSYSLSGQEISSATDFMEVSGFAPLVGDSSTGQLYTFEDLALPKTLAITGISMGLEQGILGPVPSVEWIKRSDPDSMWTKPANPNSAWVKKDSPSSEWNKK
jgi:hypothetical protein